ncbi:MAG: hypothetical protein V1732_02710 [Patescibacteria group bacterium]
MDFLDYENLTMIPDQSGLQQAEFWKVSCKIDIENFLAKNNIKIITTSESVKELAQQPYKPDLFSGHYDHETTITASGFNNKQNYVLSRSNTSLTVKELDNDGYNAEVVDISKESQTFEPLLWDASLAFGRMLRKTERKNKGYADISNVYLARYLRQNGINFFLFANDKDQINQFRFEGFKYLRPADFLVWMVKDNCITRQKAVWAYEKMRKKDPQWVKKGENFKDILNN